MNDDKCPACRDYLRDCICEECRSCGRPRSLDTDDMCETCEEMGEEANEASRPAVEIVTGASVYIAVMPDGTVSVEVDLCDVLDQPTYVWQGGAEVTDDYDTAILDPIATAINHKPSPTHTFKIGA